MRAVESATGKKFSEESAANFARGADEEDLVNSGLEETIVDAYREIRDVARRHAGKADLRAASLIVAIDKIAVTYENMGIFP